MLLRILHLGSPTGLYGAERWILALIKHLDPGKIESLVAAIKDEPELGVPLCNEAGKLGFKTHVFEAYGKANISAIKQLRNFIKENKIDILHTHGYKQDIIGLLAAVNTGCRTVSTPHGWSKEPDLKLQCYEMLNRAIFPLFDAVVPLSEDLYQPLKRLPGMKNRLHLVRNGVDLSEIDSIADLAPEILRFKEKDSFVIGYIGQLIHRKGLDVLVEAAAKLPKALNWQILIVGEGNQKTSLQQKAQKLGITDRTHFLGFRKDRLALLKGFDVFVLPSRLEGIPRCLMEAMASRIPAIASDIPGCRVLIEHGNTGMLFPVDDAEALAKRIEEVAASKALRESMSTAAREFVEQKFSAKRMAREYELLYLSLVKKALS